MNFINNIKSHYNIATNNGKESQIMQIGFMIGLLPFFSLCDNKYKIIRFLGILMSMPWVVLFMPIMAPICILGFIQFLWQEI